MKQRLLFYFSFFAIAFLLNIEFVHGVIAYPNPVDYKLPNGTSITIRLMGDEKVNWAETLDGYSILLNEKGFYEYTILNDDDNMVRSGVLVSSEGKRTVEEQEFLKKVRKGLRFSQSQISIMLQIWDINEKEAAKAFSILWSPGMNTDEVSHRYSGLVKLIYILLSLIKIPLMFSVLVEK